MQSCVYKILYTKVLRKSFSTKEIFFLITGVLKEEFSIVSFFKARGRG